MTYFVMSGTLNRNSISVLLTMLVLWQEKHLSCKKKLVPITSEVLFSTGARRKLPINWLNQVYWEHVNVGMF